MWCRHPPGTPGTVTPERSYRRDSVSKAPYLLTLTLEVEEEVSTAVDVSEPTGGDGLEATAERGEVPVDVDTGLGRNDQVQGSVDKTTLAVVALGAPLGPPEDVVSAGALSETGVVE